MCNDNWQPFWMLGLCPCSRIQFQVRQDQYVVFIDLFNSRLRDVTNMADFQGKDTPKCIVVNGNNLGFWP